MVSTTRVKTYSPGDIITAADVNAIQDHITDTANVVNRAGTLSTAESIWVDRSLQDSDATVSTVADRGFVKLQVGGQRGWLVLPGVPDGLALESLRIRCYIPDNDVSFALWQTVATEDEGLSITGTDSSVPDWPTITTSGVGWGTLKLTGPPVSPSSDTVLWVLVQNLHTTDEFNSLLLSSVQCMWG